MLLFYIYYERTHGHPILIFLKRGVLWRKQIGMCHKASALYKRLRKRGNYWKGV